MKEIKKLDIISCAKIHAVVLAIFGLIVGLFIGAFSSLISSFSDDADEVGFKFKSFGLFSIIIFPIIYAIAGFIGGLITGAIYNLVAGWVGGIKIELKDAE